MECIYNSTLFYSSIYKIVSTLYFTCNVYVIFKGRQIDETNEPDQPITPIEVHYHMNYNVKGRYTSHLVAKKYLVWIYGFTDLWKENICYCS